jgi:preprotein translocase subunit SecG
VTAVLIGCFLFNFPRFVDDYAVTTPDGSKAVIRLTIVGSNSFYQIGYSGAIYYIIVYAVPFIALIFLTERLMVSLKKFYARREQITSAGRAENDLTKALVVVVIVFMICQILNPIRRLLAAVLPDYLMLCGSVYSYFTPLTAVGVMLDSSIHFFIYSMCDRRFRVRLRQRIVAGTRMVQKLRLSSVGPSVAPQSLAISAIAGSDAGSKCSIVKKTVNSSPAMPATHLWGHLSYSNAQPGLAASQ